MSKAKDTSEVDNSSIRLGNLHPKMVRAGTLNQHVINNKKTYSVSVKRSCISHPAPPPPHCCCLSFCQRRPTLPAVSIIRGHFSSCFPPLIMFPFTNTSCDCILGLTSVTKAISCRGWRLFPIPLRDITKSHNKHDFLCRTHCQGKGKLPKN